MRDDHTHGTPPKAAGLGPEPLVAHTLDGRIVFANEAFCEQHGVSPAEVTHMAPWSWSDARTAEARAAVLGAIIETGHHVFDAGFSGDDTWNDDDAPRWRIEAWLVRLNDEPIVVSVQRDMSQQYRTAQALDFRSMLLDEVSDAIICHTLDGRMVYVNNAACVERGYTREQFMRLHLDDLVTQESASRNLAIMERLLSDGLAAFEAEDVAADGRHFAVEVHARLVELEGEPVIVSVVRDISERKRAQRAVERLAFTDALTGLPNRRVLMDRLDGALAHAARTDETIALAFIDLDHLKRINDRYGHSVGDKVLELTAMRLSACVRKGDTVARFGGDEFVVLCTGLDGAGAAERIAEKLLGVLREPLDLDGVTVTSTASIGVAVNEPLTIDASGLLGNADTAMYAVKDETRNAYAMYSPTMRLAPDPEGSPHSDEH